MELRYPKTSFENVTHDNVAFIGKNKLYKRPCVTQQQLGGGRMTSTQNARMYIFHANRFPPT